jgi:hypothetical protein
MHAEVCMKRIVCDERRGAALKEGNSFTKTRRCLLESI